MSAVEDENLATLIAMARREDLGCGDLSTALLEDPFQSVVFRLVAKAPGVFVGREIATPVLRAYDPSIEIEWAAPGRDGALIDDPPTILATMRGPLGALLAVERVLLNFLQRLSGIATLTRRFVEEVAGTHVAILDTRKTTPGWRALEKHAVRCGGGVNHRDGLYDAVLLKDNHLAGIEPQRLAAKMFEMLNRLGELERKPSFIEVEASSPLQVGELLKVVGIDIILLDNFSVSDLREAVEMRDQFGLRGKVLLEASGGVDFKTVRVIAETGVDRISIGALTHSAASLDLSMERAGC